MKRLFITIIAVAGISLLALNKTCAQSTSGTMTFTVKTISNNTGFSPKHVLAIWIKDGQGNFVKSCKVMANVRKIHLVKWNANSSGNSTNAITGATLTSHQTHTITWDGKDYAGNLVADGVYQVWVEYTSQNSASGQPAGPYMSVEFTKSTETEHLTPSNLTYFNNIVLDWVPEGVGVDEARTLDSRITVYPNPSTDGVKVKFDLDKLSQLQSYVVDQSGRMVALLAVDVLNAGSYELTWDGKNDQGVKSSAGIYFIVVKINGVTSSRKVLLLS
jgi:flagellar hook assembly protein FlgD